VRSSLQKNFDFSKLVTKALNLIELRAGGFFEEYPANWSDNIYVAQEREMRANLGTWLFFL